MAHDRVERYTVMTVFTVLIAGCMSFRNHAAAYRLAKLAGIL